MLITITLKSPFADENGKQIAYDNFKRILSLISPAFIHEVVGPEVMNIKEFNDNGFKTKKKEKDCSLLPKGADQRDCGCE